MFQLCSWTEHCLTATYYNWNKGGKILFQGSGGEEVRFDRVSKRMSNVKAVLTAFFISVGYRSSDTAYKPAGETLALPGLRK